MSKCVNEKGVNEKGVNGENCILNAEYFRINNIIYIIYNVN